MAQTLKTKIPTDTSGSLITSVSVCLHAKLTPGLPVKTLTAHRDCISTMGMIGPFAWNRPIMARVGGERDGGNTLLEFERKCKMIL